MLPYLSFCRIIRRKTRFTHLLSIFIKHRFVCLETSTINYYSFHKHPNRINLYLNSFKLKTCLNVPFQVYEIPKTNATFEIHVTVRNT